MKMMRRRRRREAFEVRKSGSQLVTQLRGWDLWRYQGSVRRPEWKSSDGAAAKTDNIRFVFQNKTLNRGPSLDFKPSDLCYPV